MQDSGPMAEAAAFLSGLRVLDLSIWRPGPYATSLLVPLGADVLKVEPPGGDPMRHYPGLFAAINEGKRSLELNLKDAGDRVHRAGAGGTGRCGRGGIPPRGPGPARTWTSRPCGP